GTGAPADGRSKARHAAALAVLGAWGSAAIVSRMRLGSMTGAAFRLPGVRFRLFMRGFPSWSKNLTARARISPNGPAAVPGFQAPMIGCPSQGKGYPIATKWEAATAPGACRDFGEIPGTFFGTAAEDISFQTL